MDEPKYIQVPDWAFDMYKRVNAEQEAFEGIFTPSGLLAMYGVKRQKIPQKIPQNDDL